MEELIIKTDNLTYSVGGKVLLKDISLEVPRGSIYGFLGPNGAGKTTTIKLLLNLIRSKNDNEISIFGLNYSSSRLNILSQIGSLIEMPSLYEHMSGEQNLINRIMQIGGDKTNIHELLEVVGLNEPGNLKVAKYSLGMKQRLGIAMALLNNPKLLILDEPTNGLDPNGIVEIRDLLKRLSKEQKRTVFVSSHLLSEVERIADFIGIIHKGKLLYQGKIEEMSPNEEDIYIMQVSPLNDCLKFLLDRGYNVELASRSLRLRLPDKKEIATLNRLLILNDFSIYSVSKEQTTLENIYLNLIKREP